MLLVAAFAEEVEAPVLVEVQRRLGLEIEGYVQPQLVFSQESEAALDADGRPLNQDRFRIRRSRIEVRRSSRYWFAGVEIDANTMDRTSISLAGAEVAALLPGEEGRGPVARLGFGLDRVPFGFELLQTIRERPFAERTVGSRAFFPNDSDVGLKLSGAIGPLRYAVAAVNGVPIGPDAETTVLNDQKTGVGRVGVDTSGDDEPAVRIGVSMLKGTGLHVGTPVTKATLQWQDTNQDGIVTLNELIGVPGQAATPSETFSRWGVNADAGVAFETVLGRTELGAELTVAANLDRGFFVADPVATGTTLRELAWTAYALQDLTPRALVGVRLDEYSPTSELFEARHGELLLVDASVFTVTGLGRVRWPKASVTLQYDYVVDLLAVDARGEPVDLPNDVWTLASQVEF